MSFGVQAVQDDLLQKIGRIHTIKEADMAIEMAQKIGFKNISVDLMYGLPGQTLEMLKEAVSWAVNKNIQQYFYLWFTNRRKYRFWSDYMTQGEN